MPAHWTFYLADRGEQLGWSDQQRRHASRRGALSRSASGSGGARPPCGGVRTSAHRPPTHHDPAPLRPAPRPAGHCTPLLRECVHGFDAGSAGVETLKRWLPPTLAASPAWTPWRCASCPSRTRWCSRGAPRSTCRSPQRQPPKPAPADPSTQSRSCPAWPQVPPRDDCDGRTRAGMHHGAGRSRGVGCRRAGHRPRRRHRRGHEVDVDRARERFGSHADKLLAHGQYETPAEFARRCKKLAGEVTDESERATRQERCRQQHKFTHWSDPDGMCHTKLSLDPLADAQMWALINQTLAAQSAVSGEVAGDMTDDHRTFDQRRADILLDLICRPGGLNGVGDSGGHAPTVPGVGGDRPRHGRPRVGSRSPAGAWRSPTGSYQRRCRHRRWHQGRASGPSGTKPTGSSTT